MTDDEIQSIKRRHEAALDSFASSHADRGVLLAEVLRLRAQRALENEDLTRAFDMGRDKGQEHERGVVLDYLAYRGEMSHYADAVKEFVHARHEVAEGVHHTLDYEELLP